MYVDLFPGCCAISVIYDWPTRIHTKRMKEALRVALENYKREHRIEKGGALMVCLMDKQNEVNGKFLIEEGFEVIGKFSRPPNPDQGDYGKKRKKFTLYMLKTPRGLSETKRDLWYDDI